MAALRRAWKFLLWERTAALALISVAIVPAIAFTAAVVIKDTYLQSVEQTIRGDAGHSAYQFVDPRDPSPLTSSLSRRQDIAPVWVSRSLLTTKDREAAVSVDLSTTLPEREQPGFGVLVEGRYAASGEIVATRAVADELGLRIGDEVRLDEGRGPVVRLSGVVVSPTRPDDRAVYCRCPAPTGELPSRWLSSVVPFTDPQLSEPSMGRILQVRGADSSVLEAQDAAKANELSYLQRIPPFTTGLAFVLCAALAGAMRRRMLPTVQGLRAAEIGPNAAWTIPVVMIGMSVAIGTAAGMAIVVAALRLASEPMGTIVGQDWQGIAVPAMPLASYAVAVVVATTAASFALLAVPQGEGMRRPARLRTARVVAATAVVAGAAMILMPGRDGFRDPSMTIVGGLIVTAALTVLLGWGGRTAGPRRQLAAAAKPTLIAASLLVAAAVFIGTWFAAYLTTVAAGQGSSDALQPQGSLVVSGVTAGNVPALSAFAPDARALVLHAPAEEASLLRAATPQAAQCAAAMASPTLDAVISRCPLGDSVTPVNAVALSDDRLNVQPGSVLADPDLIQNGQVALLTITLDGRIGKQVQVPARPDARLRGLLPGAVISAQDPIVKTFGLRDSNKSTVVFEGFGQLEPAKRAALRATVARRASYATTSEAIAPTRDPNAILGAFIGFVAAAMGAAMIAAIGSAFNASQARLRHLFVDLGVSPADRRRLGWTSLRTLALAAVIAGASGVAAASAVTSRLDTSNLVWVLPALSAVAATVIAAGRYGLAPKTDQS